MQRLCPAATGRHQHAQTGEKAALEGGTATHRQQFPRPKRPVHGVGADSSTRISSGALTHNSPRQSSARNLEFLIWTDSFLPFKGVKLRKAACRLSQKPVRKQPLKTLTWRFLSSTIRVIWIFFLPISKSASSAAKEDYRRASAAGDVSAPQRIAPLLALLLRFSSAWPADRDRDRLISLNKAG